LAQFGCRLDEIAVPIITEGMDMYRSTSRRVPARRPRFPARLALALLGASLALICSPAPAGDGAGTAVLLSSELRPSAAQEAFVPLRVAPAQTRILREHVSSRLHRQFEDLAAYQVAPLPGMARDDWAIHRLLSETAVERAERGTRRGLEDYLRANTPVGGWIDRLDRMNPLDRLGRIDPLRDDRGAGLPGAPHRERSFDIDIGFNHITPGLEMTRRVGRGSVRTMVDVLGWIELEYVQGGLSRTRFHVGYDARHGEAVMGLRLGF
jgi:hypothetical protein